MENITQNPGFQHINVGIFLHLDLQDLNNCLQVNESWRSIIKNPSFWFQKCIQNPKFDNKIGWKITLQLTLHQEPKLEESLSKILKDIYKGMQKEENYYNSQTTPIFWAAENGHSEVVKVLAPLSDNPNKPGPFNEKMYTPIYMATMKGNLS